MMKQILIPAAAFLVTVTSVSAFNPVDWSQLDIDLSNTEVAALEEAQEIRESAHEEAKAVLEAAGIDEDRMHEIREAMHVQRQASREAVHEAIEAKDYDAFKEAAAGTPLFDAIENEADFKQLVEAHELREAGDREGAKAIMDELGIEGPGKGGRGGAHGPRGERTEA